MQAVITRPMKVAGDNGGIVSFKPSTQKNPFVVISDAVFSRLRRAGATVPYQEHKRQQPEAEPVGFEGAETGTNNQSNQGKSKKK